MIAVDSSIWKATLGHFRRCGAGRRECVVYWLGPANQAAVVDEVVHPEHTASNRDYEVNSAWLAPFWMRLASSSRSARVQVHTHAFRAFHSTSDDAFPLVRQAGFLSLVLPRFATGRPPLPEEMHLAGLDSQLRWQQYAPETQFQWLP